MENDIEHYAAKTKEKMTREERVENLQNALFNGGYTEYEETNAEAYFGSLRESQGFLRAITQNRQEKTAWKGKEKLVDNYVGVAREYLQEGRFDLVLDGHYSDGRVREAEDLMRRGRRFDARTETQQGKGWNATCEIPVIEEFCHVGSEYKQIQREPRNGCNGFCPDPDTQKSKCR